MQTQSLNVPAYHVFEFQQILSAAEINYKRLERTNSLTPFVFEVTAESDKIILAEKLLADMDVYTGVTLVTDSKLVETLNRARSFGVEVVCNKVAFRILGKPYLHRIEVKGSEGSLNRFYSKVEAPMYSDVDDALILTASRGGSGRGTVAYIDPALTSNKI